MDSPAETRSGVAVGDTEEEVYRTYEGQIESEPHVYVEGGHYLTYIPRDPADKDYKVVFFTDGSVVEEIHAGDAEPAGSVRVAASDALANEQGKASSAMQPRGQVMRRKGRTPSPTRKDWTCLAPNTPLRRSRRPQQWSWQRSSSSR
jgi:hypothetical protein